MNQKIPKDWQLFEFNKIAKLRKTKYVPNPYEHLKCLELEHFQKEIGHLNGYIDSAKQSSTKNVFKAGDILFGKLRPYLRKFNKPNFDGVCSTEIWVLDGLETCKNEYLYLLVQTDKFNYICNVSTGTHMPRADWNFVENTLFLLPPLGEQKKIALVLETWDEAIEKLSELIEQKKLFKKGLMQRLLTGKIRLPGFTQPWKKVKLGEILFPISKRNKDLKIKRVLSVTNSKGFILPEEQFTRNVASEDLSNYKIVKKGEFAYNPSRLNVGSIDRLDDFEDGVLSPMYVIFVCGNKINSEYMKHWINTKEFNIKVLNSAQGSVRETVDFNTLATIKIYLPTDIIEQQAIANILSAADDEINLLNQKLESFKTQKKGLMQQLLTGKIRVKVN